MFYTEKLEHFGSNIQGQDGKKDDCDETFFHGDIVSAHDSVLKENFAVSLLRGRKIRKMLSKTLVEIATFQADLIVGLWIFRISKLE